MNIILTGLYEYGAETWNKEAAERKRLKVEALRWLRSKSGVALMNRVGNEELRRTVVVRELAGRTGQGVLRWCGPVEGMEESCLVKTTTLNIRGTKPRGRPQIGWMDSVIRAFRCKRDVREQGRMLVHDRNDCNGQQM